MTPPALFALMFLVIGLAALLGVILMAVYWPRLLPDDTVPEVEKPPGVLTELETFVSQLESLAPLPVEGAEARITWACPDAPAKTPLVFLYLHGFSASRRESAPVTTELAGRFGANTFEARVAGHGCGATALSDTPASEWIKSALQAFEVACALGDSVVIVAMSNGASLATWLLLNAPDRTRIHALLMMAPNFGIRSRLAPVLNLPYARAWLPALFRNPEPAVTPAAEIWTSGYTVNALFEMQAMVNWLTRQDLALIAVPLALMYMPNDPTVDSHAAIRAFSRWGSRTRQLLPVVPNGDAREHVFVGEAMAPERTAWVVEEFERFLRELPPPGNRLSAA